MFEGVYKQVEKLGTTSVQLADLCSLYPPQLLKFFHKGLVVTFPNTVSTQILKSFPQLNNSYFKELFGFFYTLSTITIRTNEL